MKLTDNQFLAIISVVFFGGTFIVAGLFGGEAVGANDGTVSATVTSINSWQGSDLQTYQNLTLIYGIAGTEQPVLNYSGTVTVDCNYYHVGQTITFDMWRPDHFYNYYPYGPPKIQDIDNAPVGCSIQFMTGAYVWY